MENDFIRVYLGLMGSGKTTQALIDVQQCKRLLIYSPGLSHPLLKDVPRIFDGPEYTKDLSKFLDRHGRIRVEKQVTPSDFFDRCRAIYSTAILLDDLAALKTDPNERIAFEAFIRTVRHNGNRLVITTHRANRDLPRLVHTLATSIYYVGPGVPSGKEVDALYDLTNYPITRDNFGIGIGENPPIQVENGKVKKPAGIFRIRGA